MATDVLLGTKVDSIELLDLFPASEGSIIQYFGRIGQGKTANGTYDIIQDLMRGEVVYCNWKINYHGFDQRQSIFYILRGLLFPFSKRYYAFPAENLRYIEIDENFLDSFEKLTDCKVYLDEGHVAFDSYQMAKMSMRKRKAVLHTRHFNRTICILSQRPTAIHVTMRANVNQFYECRKVFGWPLFLFRRTEYQDMVNENVDYDKPVSTHLRRIPKYILDMYDSKYMRNGMTPSQSVKFDAFDLTYVQKLKQFFALLWQRLPLKR